MITNKAWFVCIKIERDKKSKISIPVPLYVFTQLLYGAEGLALVLDFVLPRLMGKKAYDKTFGESFSFYGILQVIVGMLETLMECGSFTLVDVGSGQGKISAQMF